MKRKRIYISGNIYGSYRAQNMIKCLLDFGHSICYVQYGYLLDKTSTFRKTLSILYFILMTPVRSFLIYRSEMFLVLPMSLNKYSIIDFLIAKFFRKKIVSDFYISMYDTYVYDRKSVLPNTFKSWYFYILDYAILKWSSRILFLTDNERLHYCNVSRTDPNSVDYEIVPICVDDAYALNNLSSPAQREYHDELVICCWWGNFIPLHGLKKIIRSFEFLKGKNFRLKVFPTPGSNVAEWQLLVQALGLCDTVEILENYSFSDGSLPKFLLQNCDIAFGIFGDSRKGQSVMPNKVADALCLGIPVITQKASGTVELLSECPSVYFTDLSANPIDLANDLMKIDLNAVRSSEAKISARAAYVQLFSPQSFKTKLKSIFEDE